MYVAREEIKYMAALELWLGTEEMKKMDGVNISRAMGI